MGFGNSGKTQQTPAERAKLEIATQQMQDWRERWLPHLTDYAKNIDRAAAPGSIERRHATALATTDSSVRFAQAGEKALSGAAQTHGLGSAKQKLGITGMGNDLATSAGLGSVQADQAVDDSTVAGLKAVTALARGDKADTVNAIGRNAVISADRARAEAEASLQEQAGYAGLAGKIVGTGAGLWQGSRPVFGGAGVNSSTPMDFEGGRYGTPQGGV